MTTIAWWLVPLGATFIAILVVSIANRPRRSGDKYQLVEQFHRFRMAMERETRE